MTEGEGGGITTSYCYSEEREKRKGGEFPVFCIYSTEDEEGKEEVASAQFKPRKKQKQIEKGKPSKI